MRALRLGTRASLLAQTQSRHVATLLQNAHPGVRVELVLITTAGDRQSAASPASAEGLQLGGLKTLFTKELEDALLDNRIDLAVHSLKDMAADLPEGLILGAVPEREDPRDAWISRDGTSFAKLPQGARIATGAVRRQIQLKQWRTDLDIVPMRGNVDTRLRKLKEENLHGIVLACAGLRRLGRASEITETLPASQMIPAIGQGCLAIEVRQNDERILGYVRALDHTPSHAAALAERAFLKSMGGTCQTPIAAHAEITGDRIRMTGWAATLDGKKSWRQNLDGDVASAATLGATLASRLIQAGFTA